MKLTLEPADIASAKVEKIEVKHSSIEEVIKEHIRNGAKTFKLVHLYELPKEFEGFIWRLEGNRTMIAIRGSNLNFQVIVLALHLPKYLSNMQALRKFKIRLGTKMHAERTDESIRLTKTVNNTEAKITLNAEII